LAVLVHGQDLHRDVARLQRALELAQHVPAQHVGQEHVERHGDWLVLQREVESLGAACRHHGLQPGHMGRIDHDAGVVGVVLDDQKRAVAGLQLVAIVGILVDEMFRQRDGRQRLRALSLGRLTHGRSGTGVRHRQVQGEGAAGAGRAAQREFAAQKARQLAADRKTEAGAAILATGAGVGLLEGFEDDLLLLRRDADPGVGNLEGHHRACLVQRGIVGPPARRHRHRRAAARCPRR
jgi:hypothetical protein